MLCILIYTGSAYLFSVWHFCNHHSVLFSHKMMRELGSWSISPDSSSRDQTEQWDLASSLIQYQKLGQAPLFAFGLTSDSKNSSQYLLSVSRGMI